MFQLILKSHVYLRGLLNITYAKYSTNIKIMRPSVGIIIIGDELLNGDIEDCNSHFLCRRLHSFGVSVKKISFLPDEIDVIAAEVKLFSKTYDHVITAGGLGPTHDDVTVQSIAKAFEEPTYAHPDLVELCKEFFGQTTLTENNLKQAYIPESSQLLYNRHPSTNQKLGYPLICVRNVLVYPGVPVMLQKTFFAFDDIFRAKGTTWYKRCLYVNAEERDNADVITEINAKTSCTIGSYPIENNSYYKNKITIESNNINQIYDTIADFKSKFKPELLVDYEEHPVQNAVKHVYAVFERPPTVDPYDKHVRESVETVETALDRYGLDKICVAFNGGKDCTALLHLVFAVARRKFESQQIKLKVLYIRSGTEFPEVELFIRETCERYEIDVMSIQGEIKHGLAELKSKHPNIKAVFMGSRQGDPYSDKLKTFQMTDTSWPEFMRVNPLLYWSYGEVWTFLRSLHLPYCSLYNHGYTSLGCLENTHPNPALQIINENGLISYDAAYKLMDVTKERDGRN